MERCSKCHKPTVSGSLSDDCRKKEEQKEALKFKATKLLNALLHGEYHNYIVNQTETFGTEFPQGFIWAPIEHKGIHHDHWTRVSQLKVGDKIFNSRKGVIEGISEVTKEAAAKKFPQKINNTKYEEDGWYVECKTQIRFANPLELNLFMKERKDLGQFVGSPFDINGDFKDGYLFCLSNELAELFEKEIKKINYKKSDCVKIINGQIVLDSQGGDFDGI